MFTCLYVKYYIYNAKVAAYINSAVTMKRNPAEPLLIVDGVAARTRAYSHKCAVVVNYYHMYMTCIHTYTHIHIHTCMSVVRCSRITNYGAAARPINSLSTRRGSISPFTAQHRSTNNQSSMIEIRNTILSVSSTLPNRHLPFCNLT